MSEFVLAYSGCPAEWRVKPEDMPDTGYVARPKTNTTIAVSGNLSGGHTFAVYSYTWKTNPRRGVCFDVHRDDVIYCSNTDRIHAAAIVQEWMRETFESIVGEEETPDNRWPTVSDSGEKKAIRMIAEADPGIVPSPAAQETAWWRALLVKYMRFNMASPPGGAFRCEPFTQSEVQMISALLDEAAHK